jgi:hypothetical protein
MSSIKPVSPIDQLHAILTDYSAEGAAKKTELLHTCSQIRFSKVNQIKQYHDQLLFLSSYTENNEIRQLAQEEMNRLCDIIVGSNDAKKELLANSGIAFTSTQGTFSFVIMKWLMEQFPEEVTIHSFDEEGAHPKDLIKHGLNEMEFELIGDEELNKIKWLERVSGFKNKKDILKWLLNRIDEMPLDTMLKEQLFESLKLYISVNPLNPQFSRSFGSIAIKERYFHTNGLLKKFNELELINKKLPAEKKLSIQQKEDVLKTARIALALLNRETDPITYGNAKDIKVFDLEHGLSIALFSINQQLRLPIESYMGFMMFKNGYPMSYGGAWLFGKRSLIGINIFEAFRGGESAFVFAQLLRTYKQAFGAEQFEVEPYQFGKNNPEGLRSGAFWFYHRFGFRPLDEKLFKLAEEEHQKIMNTKGYRSPIDVLKQFTKSNLGVNFGKDKPGLKPLQISHFITHSIAKHFKGDRKVAYKWSVDVLKTELEISISKLIEEEKYGFKKLSVFAALCLDLNKMSKDHRVQLVKLIKEKGSNEFDYTFHYTKFPFDKYFKKELLEFKVK